MTDNHPIIPSPELVQQWRDSPEYTDGKRKLVMVMFSTGKLQDIVTKASQWGADQELEACCWWLRTNKGACFSSFVERELLAARRPQPPSLKEQALEALDEERAEMSIANYKTIRAVLEALDE